MATAEVQRLLVTIGLKDGLSGPIGKINRSLVGFDKGIGKIKAGLGQLGSAAIRVGAVAAAAGVALLVTQVKAGLDSLAQLENAQAQTQAVLKSTGGVAGITALEIRSLAESLEDLAPQFDDKAIQGAENLLLTFTKIGKDIFPDATLAVLNMSQALGQDLQSSVIQIGKALNDPIRGITALRRVGVAFTKDQEAQIKALVESGRTMEAQRLILRELEIEFGGSAEGGLGKFAKVQLRIKDAVEELQMALASGLLPVLERLAPKLNAFLRDPKTVQNIERLGQQIADLFSDKNIASAGELFRGVQGAAQIAFDIAKQAVSLFRSLPPEVQKAAIGLLAISRVPGAGMIASGLGSIGAAIATGLIKGVLGINAGVVNINAGVVNGGVGVGGVGGGGRLGGIARGVAAATVILAPVAVLEAIRPAVMDALGQGHLGTVESMVGRGARDRANRNAETGFLKDKDRGVIESLTHAIRSNTDAQKKPLATRWPALQRLLDPVLRSQQAQRAAGGTGTTGFGNVAGSFIDKLDGLKVTDPGAANIASTIAAHLVDVSTNVKTLQGVQRELTGLQTAAIANGQFTLAARIGTDLLAVKAAIDSLPAPVVNVTVPVNVSVRQLATSLDFAKTYHMAGTY